MPAYIIEVGNVIKEAFSYGRTPRPETIDGLVEYAHATYGNNATLREMTPEEELVYHQQGPEFLTGLK
jgi:hypothetical protein